MMMSSETSSSHSFLFDKVGHYVVVKLILHEDDVWESIYEESSIGFRTFSYSNFGSDVRKL